MGIGGCSPAVRLQPGPRVRPQAFRPLPFKVFDGSFSIGSASRLSGANLLPFPGRRCPEFGEGERFRRSRSALSLPPGRIALSPLLYLHAAVVPDRSVFFPSRFPVPGESARAQQNFGLSDFFFLLLPFPPLRSFREEKQRRSAERDLLVPAAAFPLWCRWCPGRERGAKEPRCRSRRQCPTRRGQTDSRAGFPMSGTSLLQRKPDYRRGEDAWRGELRRPLR